MLQLVCIIKQEFSNPYFVNVFIRFKNLAFGIESYVCLGDPRGLIEVGDRRYNVQRFRNPFDAKPFVFSL